MRHSMKTTRIGPAKYPVFRKMTQLWIERDRLGLVCVQFMRRYYRGTIMGWLWLIIRPLIAVVISVIVLGKIAGISSGSSVPYLLFVLVSLSLWNLLGASLRLVTRSFSIGKRHLRNPFFPRILIPAAALIFSVIRFLVYAGMIVILLAWWAIHERVFYLHAGPGLLLAPVYLLAMLMLTLGLGLITGVLNTRHRDMQYSVSYVGNILMFMSPVLYPLTSFPEKWRPWLHLNPLTGLLEGYRWALLGTGDCFFWGQLYSLAACAGVFALGVWFLNKTETVLAPQ